MLPKPNKVPSKAEFMQLINKVCMDSANLSSEKVVTEEEYHESWVKMSALVQVVNTMLGQGYMAHSGVKALMVDLASDRHFQSLIDETV